MRRLGLRLRSLRGASPLLGGLAAAWRDLYGDRPAIDQDGVGAYTFRGLACHVEEMAGGLLAAGLESGQPALVVVANGLPQFAAILAVARAGALPIPVNPQLTRREVEGVADENGATAAVVDPAGAGSAPRLPTYDLTTLPPSAPLPPVTGGHGDVAAIFSTSGTTGRARGAELTHRGLLGAAAASMAVGGALGWSVLEALPVSHIMGFGAVAGALSAGLTVHAVERFHPVRFLEEAAALEPEVLVAVPAMYRMMLEARGGPPPEEALSSVRIFVSGSDVLPDDVAARLRAAGARGAVVVEGYGMVELSGAAALRVHLPLIGALPRGDLGLPVPPFRVRIVDDAGRPAWPLRVGHLEVKGPGVLAGYRNRPEASAEVVRGGWLRTGDLASWGPFGLRFQGRSKDVVKVGGYSVFPREVEEELRSCPGVADVAVVGLPDPVKGEILAAAVERVAGSDLSADDVQAFARGEVAGYRRPARVLVVDALPRNPNRKVVKAEVRELFADLPD